MAGLQENISLLITRIRDAELPESITNEMVAELFSLLQAYTQSLSEAAQKIEDDIELHREREYSPLKESVDRLSQRFETLLGENASDAIDNFNEILEFLAEVTDRDTLVGMLSRVNAVSPDGLGFEAGEESVTLRYNITDLTGSGHSPQPSQLPELPVAEAPFPGDDMARPRPGQAGIVTGADFGRFDSAATFAEGLADETAIRDIGFSASADKVSFTRSKYRLGGGNPWVDADGSPEAVPIDGLWPFPMSSQTSAGAVTAAQARAIANAPELAFRELWKSAGCSVKEDADPSEMYVCNGLGMSYAEARAVYAAGEMTNVDINARYAGMSIRTHLPSQIRWGASAPAPTTFRGSSVEVVAAPLLTPGTGCFRDCTKLRKASVFSPRGTGAGSDAWAGCKALETLTVAAMVPGSFSLADSPLISLASLQGIISKAWEGMGATTITLHPDTYAKMTDTERESEWTQLPALAAEKNITFTTNR